MTDRSESAQPPSQERKKVTATLGRDQLEQALSKLLASGTAAIPQQVRYILALSQLTGAKSVTTPQPEIPLSVAEARLAALVTTIAVLQPSQIRRLFKDVQQIAEDEVQLPLLLDIVQQAPGELQKTLPRLIEAAGRLSDPLTRSDVLLKLAALVQEPEQEAPQSQIATNLADIISEAQRFENPEAQVRSLVALSSQLPSAMRVNMLNQVLDIADDSQSDVVRANTIVAMADRLVAEVEDRVVASVKSIRSPSERVRALTALARGNSTTLQVRIRTVALQAISEIPNEEERTDSLITFAPYLESASEQDGFPALLEQALGIAVALGKRHNRAKALVALAPHLTLDLQGEALAAVHSLGNERDRAILLAELAPTLPPDMLVASLAVAHTMREQDSRVHALTILAQNAPKHARAQTLLDALAAASNLPHQFERVTALIRLVDVLPPHLKDQAFTNALETTRLIENENARARAFGMLGTHLPPSLLHRTLEAIYQIEDYQQRLNALIGIVPSVPKDERGDILQRMLECARNMPLDYKRSRALVSIAPHLTSDMMQEALRTAEQLDDPFDRANAMIPLVQNMPPDERPMVVNQAWKLIQYIEDGYDRSSALAALAPFLPESARSEVAQSAAEVIRSVEDEYDRASAITILAPLLTQGKKPSSTLTLDRARIIYDAVMAALDIPQQSLRARQLTEAAQHWLQLDTETCYALWREVAQRLIDLPLADVLLCLGACTPIFITLGDEDGLKEIAHILGVR